LINLNSSFLNEYLWRKLFSFPVEQKGIYSQTFETISRIKWLEVGALYAVHQGNLQTCHNACREKLLFCMDQWSMLFQVGLNTGHVDTKLADKGFSSVWINGVCSFRLDLLAMLTPN